MTTIVDWPTAKAFTPTNLKFGAGTNKSAFGGFYTGNRQTLSHLSDRLLLEITLAPFGFSEAGALDAFLAALESSGDYVRIPMTHRPAPWGTLRGSPTVSASAIAGATTLSVSTTAGATLLAGDFLTCGNQLLMTGYAGATADGTGAMTLPLPVPLQLAVASGTALSWSSPTGIFELDPSFDFVTTYTPNGGQMVVTIPFRQWVG
jgi:hypothetical protein